MKIQHPGVPSLRDALKDAERHGLAVHTKDRTGEVVVDGHGIGLYRLFCNARKKDASRALILLIRKAKERSSQ